MKKTLLFLLSFCFVNLALNAQDTFSIVAVDGATGEVGSAGATCLTSADCGGCGGAVVISGVVPGVGVVNAQAFVCIPNSNLDNAISEMTNFKSPQEILDFLLNNDACASQNNNPEFRQYGIADLDEDNEPRVAAFSGTSTSNYSNHITGFNYAIQGNILLSQEILDDMEAGFLNTQGTLAEKLMGAMQGANVPGADSRCLNDGISSKSAFLRVARQFDEPDDLYLDLIIESTVNGVDPIDSLQSLMDNWLLTDVEELDLGVNVSIYPNPSKGIFSIEIENFQQYNDLSIAVYSSAGKLVRKQPINTQLSIIDLENDSNKTYIYNIVDQSDQILNSGKLIIN